MDRARWCLDREARSMTSGAVLGVIRLYKDEIGIDRLTGGIPLMRVENF